MIDFIKEINLVLRQNNQEYQTLLLLSGIEKKLHFMLHKKLYCSFFQYGIPIL